MEELDSTTIASRSIKGVFALTVRYLFISVIGIAAQLILQYKLDPSALGVYAIVSAVIAILAYFSDIGLAAALIQKKEEVIEADLKTTFTIQQLLIAVLVLLGFLFTPFVGSIYHIDRPGTFLFQALLISFFFSSLKTIPSVLLERKLDFNRLVIPQLVETLVFHITTIAFILKGFGITSYTIAVLARGIAGLITIYIIVPWKPQIGIVRSSVKKLFSFGFPFQTNSILALLKDKLLIVILGIILTRGEIGYVYNFAQYWASIPLRFAMDSVIRVTFPSFSRLQQSKQLGYAIEKSLFLIMTIVVPIGFWNVVMNQQALIGCRSIAVAKAARSIPSLECTGISIAFMFNRSSACEAA
jgi:PST family polysaccharide transporter